MPSVKNSWFLFRDNGNHCRLLEIILKKLKTLFSHSWIVMKNSKNYRSDVIQKITHSNPTPFQSYTLPILHSSNPTLFQCNPILFQSYTLPILHSSNPKPIQSYTLPILHPLNLTPFRSYSLPILHFCNLTLFRSYTLPILHSSNPTLTH